jgi:hypothetical protein
MTDDAGLRAENEALRARIDALEAQADPARKEWTVSEIAGMDHRTYIENERAILAAFRRGRIRADPDADPGHAGRQSRQREPAAADPERAAAGHSRRSAGPAREADGEGA